MALIALSLAACLAGCGGGTGSTLVRGVARHVTGGCGAPPPSGDCTIPLTRTPMANTRLTVLPLGTEKVVAQVRTDATGAFSLRLPAGQFRIRSESFPHFDLGLSSPATDPVDLDYYLPPP